MRAIMPECGVIYRHIIYILKMRLAFVFCILIVSSWGARITISRETATPSERKTTSSETESYEHFLKRLKAERKIDETTVRHLDESPYIGDKKVFDAQISRVDHLIADLLEILPLDEKAKIIKTKERFESFKEAKIDKLIIKKKSDVDPEDLQQLMIKETDIHVALTNKIKFLEGELKNYHEKKETTVRHRDESPYITSSKKDTSDGESSAAASPQGGPLRFDDDDGSLKKKKDLLEQTRTTAPTGAASTKTFSEKERFAGEAYAAASPQGGPLRFDDDDDGSLKKKKDLLEQTRTTAPTGAASTKTFSEKERFAGEAYAAASPQGGPLRFDDDDDGSLKKTKDLLEQTKTTAPTGAALFINHPEAYKSKISRVDHLIEDLLGILPLDEKAKIIETKESFEKSKTELAKINMIKKSNVDPKELQQLMIKEMAFHQALDNFIKFLQGELTKYHEKKQEEKVLQKKQEEKDLEEKIKSLEEELTTHYEKK
eukprot:GHVL01039265.1.p1 GENE.GHVL01039265.1~~GHVL01039265.1.p1  ORF type:complete len:488 (+),score=123.74 GHVL01039265.1:2-1465(+)